MLSRFIHHLNVDCERQLFVGGPRAINTTRRHYVRELYDFIYILLEIRWNLCAFFRSCASVFFSVVAAPGLFRSFRILAVENFVRTLVFSLRISGGNSLHIFSFAEDEGTKRDMGPNLVAYFRHSTTKVIFQCSC